MSATAVNQSLKVSSFTAKSETKKLFWMIMLLFALIIGRAYNNSFFYVFAAISLIIFIIADNTYCIPLLFFLLPFSTLLKLNSNTISFFTVLFFLTVLKMALAQKKLGANFISALFAIFIYCLLQSGLSQITTIVTMVAGFLMLYCMRSMEVDANTVVVSYSVGIFLASVLAECRSFLPIVRSFVQYSILKFGENSYVFRFAGLQGNPNYYTMDIIMVLAAIVVLIRIKQSSFLQICCFVALSAFGIMSVSKSFLISWVILILCWLFLSVKHRISNVLRLIFILAITAMAIYYFAYDYVNSYLLRFMDDSIGTASSFTTGRTVIWKAYIETIFSNSKILWFGNGLNTIASNMIKGTHNTFLECLFSLGIFGTVLYIIALKNSMGKIITKKIVWVPILMLLIRMLAIGILTYDNIYFYFAIILMVAKACQVSEENIV